LIYRGRRFFLKRLKKQFKLTPTETKKAAIGIRSLIKQGAIPEKNLVAFTKFLRTKKGEEWARINLTPSKIKKGAKR
jgi:hypothetical protein